MDTVDREDRGLGCVEYRSCDVGSSDDLWSTVEVRDGRDRQCERVTSGAREVLRSGEGERQCAVLVSVEKMLDWKETGKLGRTYEERIVRRALTLQVGSILTSIFTTIV